jgi:type I restriction enzyme M protein
MTKPIRFEHCKGCIDWWGGKERKVRDETPLVTAAEVKARGYNLDIKNPHGVADDHGDPKTLLTDLAAAETLPARTMLAIRACLDYTKRNEKSF